MSHPLFQALSLGPITLRNRTLRAAAFEGMAPNHRPSEALLRYHQAVAEGGIGMSTVAYAAMDRTGLAFEHQLWLRPELVPELRRLTDSIHRAGAKASLQLGHCGNMAQARLLGHRPWAPSARFNLYGPSFPKAMDTHDIRRLIAQFVHAVTVCRDAGFDAVELHAGHGYLLSQFLSPYTNHRRDAYGGSFERRVRLLREVMAAVTKAAQPDLCVLVKTNLRDGFDGGMQLDEALRVAALLEQDGAHALVLTGGFVSRAPMYIMRGAMPTRTMAHWMREWWLRWGLALTGKYLLEAFPYEENYFLADARIVRRAVKLPLIYVGGVVSRAGIETLLEEGFDGVAMARALIREPNFVQRLAREIDARSPCDHCNYCAARIYTRPMACHHVSPPTDAKTQAVFAQDLASSRPFRYPQGRRD